MGSIEQKAVGTKKTKNTGPLSDKVQELLRLEVKHAVGGFCPIPAFVAGGKGSEVYDADGKQYIDFIASFSAGNLGQCHPKLTKAVIDSLQKVTIANPALRVAEWPPFAEMMCKRFGYDQICALVSGAEAADTAVKVARIWGLQVKKIPVEKLKVLGVGDNYHGLSAGVWPLMTDTPLISAYGLRDPVLTNTNPSTGEILKYRSLEDMELCLKEHHQNVAAVIMECIHGHAPDFQADINYARGVALLCKKYNVLFISDEIRMGAGKTGRWLCSDWLGPDAKPDMICIGKSLTGGIYPASFVLGNKEQMSLVQAFTCGGTFSHTPTAIAAARAAIEIIDEEGLVERATKLGNAYMERTKDWPERFPYIWFTTCRGADIQLVMTKDAAPDLVARRFSALAMAKGLLTHPLEGGVRMSLAMTMTDEVFQRGLDILEETAIELAEYSFIAGAKHEKFSHLEGYLASTPAGSDGADGQQTKVGPL